MNRQAIYLWLLLIVAGNVSGAAVASENWPLLRITILVTIWLWVEIVVLVHRYNEPKPKPGPWDKPGS